MTLKNPDKPRISLINPEWRRITQVNSEVLSSEAWFFFGDQPLLGCLNLYYPQQFEASWRSKGFPIKWARSGELYKKIKRSRVAISGAYFAKSFAPLSFVRDAFCRGGTENKTTISSSFFLSTSFPCLATTRKHGKMQQNAAAELSESIISILHTGSNIGSRHQNAS